MKRKILASSIAAAIFSLVTSPPTFSYLTDFEVSANTFTAGNVEINAEMTQSVNCSNIETNGTCRETIKIANTGHTPAYVGIEVRIPENSLLRDQDDLPLYYSLNIDESGDFTLSKEETLNQDGINYRIYRYIRNDFLAPGSESGTIELGLTNHQVATVASENLNGELCDGTDGSCATVLTAGLVNANVEIYAHAIQKTGFESADEALSGYGY